MSATARGAGGCRRITSSRIESEPSCSTRVPRAASSGTRGMASQGAKPEALEAAKDIARESIIKLLEVNRRTRAGFLVPRTEQGELAVLENTCLVKLYELHREMQLDLEDGANVADRLSREELDALRSRDGGGDGQLLQKAAVKSAVTHQTGKANVLRRRRMDEYKKKDLNDTAINKAQDARSQAERLAKMCQLKLSYEVAMLSVGEPQRSTSRYSAQALAPARSLTTAPSQQQTWPTPS